MSGHDPPKKTYHRSVSQLKTYARCGEQFRLQRMVWPRLPERPASWLILGQAFHETFSFWETQDRKIDALEYFHWSWDDQLAKFTEKQPDMSMWLKPPRSKIENDLANRKNAGVKMVENYIDDATSGEWTVYVLPDGTKAVELPFSVTFGQTEVVGYIDLLKKWKNSAYPTVADLKSGNREKSNIQLGVYGAALRQMGINTRYGEYWYAKDRVSSGFTSLDRYTDELVASYFDNLDSAVNNNIFIPNPGDHCGLCPVRDYCREMGTLSTFDKREATQ